MTRRRMTRRRYAVDLSEVPTREECERLGRHVLDMVSVKDAYVHVGGDLYSTTKLVRGDIQIAAEARTYHVSVMTYLGDGRCAAGTTDRLDDEGLRTFVKGVEEAARQQQSPSAPFPLAAPKEYPPAPKLYFDSVLPAMRPEARMGLVDDVLNATEHADLIAAGDLTFSVSGSGSVNTLGNLDYIGRSMGEFSLTARTKDGTGSGWAWGGFEDWSRVDPKAVTARAVDLAVRSQHPVAVEPGRYTVILEPAAVASLISVITTKWSAMNADAGGSVFSGPRRGTNKIGLQMMDRRLGMVSDPWDPDLPQSIFTFSEEPLKRVEWFKSGILTNLMYDSYYAREKRRSMVQDPGGVRVTYDGPTQTLDQMIANTERGLWINRLSGGAVMNDRTLLLTGTTRDGTFLIEKGRITKPVKNLRFMESPFFVLNKVEAVGEAIRASGGVVAPRIKARDFDFTSVTDAI